MWLIQPPVTVFNYIYDYDSELSFQVLLLIPEKEYAAFNTESLNEIEQLVSNGILEKQDVKVKDPNNPVNLIAAKAIILKVK